MVYVKEIHYFRPLSNEEAPPSQKVTTAFDNNLKRPKELKIPLRIVLPLCNDYHIPVRNFFKGKRHTALQVCLWKYGYERKREGEELRGKREPSRTELIKMQWAPSSKALFDSYITKVFNPEKAYTCLCLSPSKKVIKYE